MAKLVLRIGGKEVFDFVGRLLLLLLLLRLLLFLLTLLLPLLRRLLLLLRRFPVLESKRLYAYTPTTTLLRASAMCATAHPQDLLAA